jgi:transmembrane sensor
MLENQFHISKLITAHLQGRLGDAEKLELEAWIASSDDYRMLFEQLNDTEHVTAELKHFTKPNKSRIWNKLQNEISVRPLRPRLSFTGLFFRYAAAALVLFVLGVTLFYFNKFSFHQTHNIDYVTDIAPGKTGATLTLANGKKIRLSDVAGGELARESGIRINKTEDGQLTYSPDENSKISSNEINTLSTDRGEIYTLVLPDGSKVWMNAASSLTYSAGLLEKGIRKVKLSGEAYFEISKDKHHPFVVESKGQQVQVLGTHFNISAYQDDKVVSTTLLEGSVRVSGEDGYLTKILNPDQQAVFGADGISIKNVDANSFVDWKNGVFSFEDETMQSVMKKIARWYNVAIVYDGVENDAQTFSGSVSRSANVSEVLGTLTDISNVKFRIEGKKIFVSK